MTDYNYLLHESGNFDNLGKASINLTVVDNVPFIEYTFDVFGYECILTKVDNVFGVFSDHLTILKDSDNNNMPNNTRKSLVQEWIINESQRLIDLVNSKNNNGI